MGRRASVTAEIDIQIVGSKTAIKEIGSLSKVVETTGKQLERIEKRGGLTAITVGQERIKAAQTEVAALAVQLQNASNKADELRRQMAAVPEGSSEYNKLNKQLVGVEHSAARAAAEMAAIPRNLREEVSQTVGFLGDIDSSLQAIGGTISSLSDAGINLGPISGLDQEIKVAGDIFAAAEAIPRLVAGLQTLRANILLMTQNFATMAPAIGLAAAAAVSYIAIMEASKFATEKATKGTKDWLDTFEDFEVPDLSELETGTDITAKNLDALVAEQERYQQGLQQQKSDLDFVNEEYKKLEGNDKAIVKVAEFGDALGLIENPIDEIREKSKEVNAELKLVNANLELLNNAYTRQSIAIRGVIDSIDASIKAELERGKLIEGSSEDALKAAEDINKEIVATEKVTRQAIIDVIEQQAPELQKAVRQIIGPFEDFDIDTAIEALDLLKISSEQTLFAISGDAEKLSTQEKAQKEASETTLDAITAIDNYNEHMAELATQQDDIITNIIPLIEAREAETQSLEELQQLAEESAESIEELNTALDKTQGELSKAVQEFDDFIKQDMEKARRSAIEQRIMRKIDAAKEAEELQKREKQIRDVRTESADKVTEIIEDTNAERAKLIEDNQADLIKLEEDHRKKLRDITDQEQDAELKNDVNAFIAAQKQREKAEDEFSEQTTELEQQLREQLRELRRAGREEINVTRQTAIEKINTLRQAAQQEVSLSQQLQQQLANVRATWAQQDAQAQRQAQIRTHQERIAQLQQETAAITAQRAAAQVRSSLSQQRPVGSISSFFDRIRANIPRLDDGGVVSLDKPQLVQLGPKPGFFEEFNVFRAGQRNTTTTRTFSPQINVNGASGDMEAIGREAAQKVMEAMIEVERKLLAEVS